jgi:transcriptional regulator with XRE-family HTH domain
LQVLYERGKVGVVNVLKVGTFIRDQRLSAKLSLRKAAGLAGVSIPYLSQIERGLRKPSAEILQAIAKGLRISAETLYVQAGILDERPASDVAASLMADISITESQRQALLQIYRAFQEETGRATKVSGPGGARRKKNVATASAKAASAGPTHRTAGTGRSRRAGGGTVSKAGSSPHPAPTRSPATNPNGAQERR